VGSVYVVFLCGGIASGKSTVGRALAARGVRVLDLDAISREVTQDGDPTLKLIANEFGADVLDSNGELVRPLLAQRAFANEEMVQRLEAIMHPAIRARLAEHLRSCEDGEVCVVEVPLLDRVEDLARQADEVLCVVCPLELRRTRAIGRGMNPEDFDARVAQQPSDEYLIAHADHVIVNDSNRDALLQKLDAWWNSLPSRRDSV